MGRFHDTLSSLGTADDGISIAYPDTFTDDISAAYDEDIAGPTAKIAVLEADLAAATAKIDELKAHNYDLMTQVPAAPVDEDPDPEPDPEDEPGEKKSNLDAVFGN